MRGDERPLIGKERTQRGGERPKRGKERHDKNLRVHDSHFRSRAPEKMHVKQVTLAKEAKMKIFVRSHDHP